jgi:hypothetical protein
MVKANLVLFLALRILVWELLLLLLFLFTADPPKKPTGGLTPMFRKILIVGWTAIFGSMLLLAIFPRLAFLLPNPDVMLAFLIPFALVSLVYGIVWLYRQGINQAGTK